MKNILILVTIPHLFSTKKIKNIIYSVKNKQILFIISDKSKMVKIIHCIGYENSGTRRVDYDGNFSEEMVKDRTKGGKLEERLARNVCYNSEIKIYGHSLEEARQKKKVGLNNEVVDVGRDGECEEREGKNLLTLELVI